MKGKWQAMFDKKHIRPSIGDIVLYQGPFHPQYQGTRFLVTDILSNDFHRIENDTEILFSESKHLEVLQQARTPKEQMKDWRIGDKALFFGHSHPDKVGTIFTIQDFIGRGMVQLSNDEGIIFSEIKYLKALEQSNK